MGGGNAQKSAMSRAKNQEAAKKAGGGVSQLKQNQAAINVSCFVCKQGFLCTAAEVKLREHSDNKHPKNTFLECFPHMKPAE